jgi:glycosyltransferase involved in cell wall biosynthesis
MSSLMTARDQLENAALREARGCNRRLRILHVQSGREYGGIQRMLVCLAESRELCPSLEPEFVLCYQEQLARELAACGASLRDLGPARLREPWGILRANRRLRALLTGEEIDAVVCHGSPLLAGFGATVKSCGVPLVYWMHNDIKKRNKNIFEFLAGRQTPDLVIANSAFTAASLPLQFVKVPPHVVIPCPVTEPPRSRFDREQRATLRAQLGAGHDDVAIILVARLEAWKGHGLLLEALARIRSNPKWRCWIVGGVFDRRQKKFFSLLQRLARNLGLADRVQFLGQRRDVPELLRAADIFCQPNISPEPFGIAFVEALYAGLPVITANHGGATEIVDDTTGRLVEPNDPDALAGALEELVNDSSQRALLSQNAPARGAAISDPAKVLVAIYEQIFALKQRMSAGRETGSVTGKR